MMLRDLTTMRIHLRGANDNRRAAPRPSGLTIEELLAEPMVRDLMQADRVDPAAFEALLRALPMGRYPSVASCGKERPSLR